MIFLYSARLVILSQPKTGTTALDRALGERASIAVNNPPQLKHIQYHKFMRFMAPLILGQTGLERKDYDVISVMREPADWLGSWYRYRSRETLKESKKGKKRDNYTGDVSFDDFVREIFKPKAERQSFANLGSPCGVALDWDGSVGCDMVFPYEDLSGLYEMIEMRTRKPVELSKLNVSPEGDVTLSDETRALLRAHWSFAFDLHGSLNAGGGVDERFRHPQKDGDEDPVV